ncbi:MAG: outer membrane protein assembly factor BamD [Acidobacteriota bacterium]
MLYLHKKAIVLLLLLIAIIFAAPVSTAAQGSLQQQPPLDLPRNAELEQEAKHNLDVARFYLKRKAYKAVTDRLLEISYVYPQFSRFDEVLSLLGETFLKMDDKKEAAKHYQRLVNDFPESQYAKEAKKKLADLPSVPNNN